MAAREDRALILKRYPYGESSLVLHVLTRAHGRVHLLAKGAYRATSRYAWVLDLFDTLELAWSHRPGRELQILQAAALLARRRGATADLGRYRAALAVLELIELGAREGQSEPELFALGEAALDRIAGGEADPAHELIAFDLRFLRCLGLQPALLRCAACDGPAPPVAQHGADGPRAAFSAGAGGRLCRACADEARASGRRVGTLPVEVLTLSQALLERPSSTLSRADPRRVAGVRDFVQRFLEYHLETRPRSRRGAASVGRPRGRRRAARVPSVPQRAPRGDSIPTEPGRDEPA